MTSHLIPRTALALGVMVTAFGANSPNAFAESKSQRIDNVQVQTKPQSVRLKNLNVKLVLGSGFITGRHFANKDVDYQIWHVGDPGFMQVAVWNKTPGITAQKAAGQMTTDMKSHYGNDFKLGKLEKRTVGGTEFSGYHFEGTDLRKKPPTKVNGFVFFGESNGYLVNANASARSATSFFVMPQMESAFKTLKFSK
jgi:hypothetical protein